MDFVNLKECLAFLKQEYYLEKNFYSSNFQNIRNIIFFLDFFSIKQYSFKRSGHHFINKNNQQFYVANCKLYKIQRFLQHSTECDIIYRKDQLYYMSAFDETDFIATVKKTNTIQRYYFDTVEKVYIDYIESKIQTSNGYHFIHQFQTNICKDSDSIDLLMKTLENLNSFLKL